MAPDGSLRIELVAESGDWTAFDPDARIAVIAQAVARYVDAAVGEVALVLADDRRVRELNLRFRGKDRPTNVLSFPAGSAPASGNFAASHHLGDVVLAAETLAREAGTAGVSAGDHFTHLAIHGILHLLGYDHQAEQDADAMESLETAILADLGIADPYAGAALAESDH